MKALLSKLLGAELYSIVRRSVSYRKKRRSGRYARFDIDKVLEQYLPHNNGFYVELGANDGALASNSYYFELKKGWRGILIEPAPNLFLSCLKRRAENNKIFCNACVPFDYQNEYVRMKYADSMTISDSLDLDIGDKEDFLKSGTKFLQSKEIVFEFGSKAATLSSLLDRGEAPHLIDFLSLDVEGAELCVLEGVDFKKYNFKYIVVEFRDIDRLMRFLSPHKYALKDKLSHHDYLIEKQDEQT